MVVLRAEDTAFVRSNPACQAVLGYEGMLVGTFFLNLVDYNDLMVTSRTLSRAVRDNKPERLTHRIGVRRRTIDWTVCPTPDGHLLLVGRDVTEDRAQQERLYQLAHYDDVTGLPNRLLFRDRGTQGLAHARREGRQAAVVFIDLDDFKPVNDRFGHAAGDEVLKEIGHRLTAQVRETDTVSRLAGDEFVVFLSLIQETSVEQLVKRLVAALEPPYPTGRGEVQVHASHGFAVFPDDGTDLDTLLGVADDRMYEFKRSKKKE